MKSRMMIVLLSVLAVSTASAQLSFSGVNRACGVVVDIGTGPDSKTKGLQLSEPGVLFTMEGPRPFGKAEQVVILTDLTNSVKLGDLRPGDLIQKLSYGQKICVQGHKPNTSDLVVGLVNIL
ncbi:MAG: hypothetical protein ACK5P5_10150 [Pseudobdellovibrionaceae bacterium]